MTDELHNDETGSRPFEDDLHDDEPQGWQTQALATLYPEQAAVKWAIAQYEMSEASDPQTLEEG